MGTGYMIITMDPNQTIFDANTFIEEAQQQWPGCQTYRKTEYFIADAGANISPLNSSTFMIDHFPDNHMISVDGTPEHAAEVAAWVRSLFPDPNLILWLLDGVLSGHTVLFPGITPQEVLDNWVDHNEHDPYIEYPHYFH